MRHSQLRAFHHVALAGGFSAAAKRLNQTQPSLSEQVRKLEQTYDLLLFHRAGRSLSLTRAGEKLLVLTRRYFEMEGEISATLSAARTQVDGRLRIVADSAHHLTGALGRFRASHPRAFVELRAGNSETVLDALRRYEAEIGVIGRADPGAEFSTLPLGQNPIVALTPRALAPGLPSPLRLEDLAAHPLIFREQGSRTRSAVERAAKAASVPLQPVMVVEGREAMREIVASGAGIGFASQAEIGNDARLAGLVLEDPGLTMPETLVYLTQRADMRLIRAFLPCVAGRET